MLIKKGVSLKDNMAYRRERTKKGAKDRNGKVLSEFERGKNAGILKALCEQASFYNYKKNGVKSNYKKKSK